MALTEYKSPYISDVPLFLQQKVCDLGRSNNTMKWANLESDELELLSTQFLMFGRNFRERLHKAVETRLMAKICPDSLENTWLPEFQKHMPVIIKYDPDDISLEPSSLKVNGSLIWHALKSVSEKTGIPLSQREQLDGHPDLDTRMVIAGADGVFYQGESTLGHEARHCEEMCKSSPKMSAYIILDYGVRNGVIGRMGCAFAHGAIKDSIADVYVSLAPRFPSGPDMKDALRVNPILAMSLLRQKATYNLLSEERKKYIEDHLDDDPEGIVFILQRAEDELYGFEDFQYIDSSKIAWRKFPWEQQVKQINHLIRIPVPIDVL